MHRPDAQISSAAGRGYWEGVDADVSGMLGGFPAVSHVDVLGSRAFLAKMGIGARGKLRKVERVLEGGAGIGRVTQAVLAPISGAVDAIEPVAKFTGPLSSIPGVGRVFAEGLEDWRPDEGDRYDVVWNQWCVGQLRDDDLVEYLVRCKGVLTDGGFIVVKENLSTQGKDVYDAVDSCVTREDEKFRELFERAGLAIVRTEPQKGLPAGLLPVRTYALKPTP